MNNPEKSHRSIRYIIARILEKLYRSLNNRKPWLSPAVNQFLIKKIQPDWTAFEYGSGRSTLWLAHRIKSLISVEHNPEWHERVTKELNKHNLLNVELLLCKREEDKEPEGIGSKYVSTILKYENTCFDLILVDGVYRAECACQALAKLNRGGILIIDDVHRYLPSRSFSPFARKINEGPLSEKWTDFLEKTSNWDRWWTSNGVSDTAVFYKPK